MYNLTMYRTDYRQEYDSLEGFDRINNKVKLAYLLGLIQIDIFFNNSITFPQQLIV